MTPVEKAVIKEIDLSVTEKKKALELLKKARDRLTAVVEILEKE